MRASVASISRKFISSFFAATLALGLVPVAAFAAPESDADDGAAVAQNSDAAIAAALDGDAAASQENSGAAGAASDIQAPAEAGAYDSTSDATEGASGTEYVGDALASSNGEGSIEDAAETGDGSNLAIPAGEIINQEMPLEVVAQSESTRSFFLAQTLESTRTVPVVSAKLPIDTGANSADVAENESSDGSEGDGTEEGGEDSDESDPAEGEDTTPAVNPDSVVIGSFEQDGIVYAMEPGGETVAAVAVDYAKLPEELVQKQVLVVPEAVTPDGYEHYSVTRIAANAFSGLTKETANPDYTGAVALFSDEELLAEAGIDPADVADFISSDDAAVAAKSDESAGADSIDMPKTEALGYEDQDQDQATADESSDSGSIRTIVSMDGNTATLDDGSTYTFTNPLAGCAGILALGIPASVTSIEDGAFEGFDTLQYAVVAEGNTEYASYDGALYSADLAQLRLIPEGRVGAVRVASSATSVLPEVFSHCPSVDALVADAEGGIVEKAVNVGMRVVHGEVEGGLLAPILSIVCDNALPTLSPPTFGSRLLDSAGISGVKLFPGTYATWGYDRHRESGNDEAFGLADDTKNFGAKALYKYYTNGNTIILYASSSVDNGIYGDSLKTPTEYSAYACEARWWPGDTPVEDLRFADGKTFARTEQVIGSEFLGTPQNSFYVAVMRPLGCTVVWDAGAYGGKVIQDSSKPISEDNLGFARTMEVDLGESGLAAKVTCPGANEVVPPKGFSFKGWAREKTDADGKYVGNDAHGNKVLDDTYLGFDEESVEITSNITFYAVFEAEEVVFDASTYGGMVQDSDGNLVDSITLNNVRYGDNIPVPTVEDKGDGWHFKGWATRQKDENGELVRDGLGNIQLASDYQSTYITATKDNYEAYSDENANERLRYYAVWSLDVEWTISSDDVTVEAVRNGALVNATTPDGAIPRTEDIMYGDLVVAPGISSVESHRFWKWHADGNPLAEGQDFFPQDDDLTTLVRVCAPGKLEANWAPNIYKVAVLDEGGNVRSDAMPGTSFKLDSLYMKYADGWFTDAACGAGAAIGADPAASAPLASDQFAAMGYTRDFASTTPEFWTTGSAADGFAYDHTAARPNSQAFTNSHSDYDFTDETNTTRQVYLYPVWQADVTWSNPHGTTAASTNGVVDHKRVNLGRAGKVDATAAAKTVVCKDQGTRPGYKPLGWKVLYATGATDDNNGAYYQTGDTITISGPCTIEAQWAAIEYYVTLDFDTTDLIEPGAWNSITNQAQQSSWTAAPDAANGGNYKVSAGVYTVENGTSNGDGTLTVTLPSFNRKGYEIDHWMLVGSPTAGNHTDASNSAAVAGALPSTFAGNAISFPTGTGATGAVRASFTLKATWKEATGYDFARYEQLDGNAAAALAAGSAPSYNNALASIPQQYSVTGLNLNNHVSAMQADAKPGYTFAGWRAYSAKAGADRSKSVLVANDANDAETAAAVAANQPAKNVSLPAGFIGDDELVLVACFTTNYYGLTLNKGLADANEGSFGSTWTAPDAAGERSYQTLNVQENGQNAGTKPGFTVRTGAIALPSPSRTGQQFMGWKVEKKNAAGDYAQVTDSNALAALLTKGANWTFNVAPDMLGDYRLTGQWQAADYAITFSNTKYITGQFVAGGNSFDADATNKYLFDGDNLTSGGTVVVAEPTADGTPGFDAARYTAFKGWYLPEGVSKPADSTNTWQQDGNRWFARSITVNQGNVEALCGGADGLQLEARFDLREYTATLDLQGGKLSADAAAAGWLKDAQRTDLYTRTYTCETADATATGQAFQLPAPTRYGYQFNGWDLAVDGAPEGFAQTIVDGQPGWWQAADLVGDRTYTVTPGTRWIALEDKVTFRNNFPAGVSGTPGLSEAAEIPVSFGARISQTNLPSAEGYYFKGYFDTADPAGGKQYFDNQGAAVRDWDLAPEYAGEEGSQSIVPHVLYARWEANVPEGTPSEFQPVPGHIVGNPPNAAQSSQAVFNAKKGEGSTQLGTVPFNAFYNGFYTADASGKVAVSIDSFVLADGITAEGIYNGFERTDPSGKNHLQGFMVDSTGDIISFADIARGSAFSFTFMAADLGQAPNGAPASFQLEGLKLTALYTAKPFDFSNPEGGEPPSILPVKGDEILAVFDANGGTITVDGKAIATAMTTTVATKTAEQFAAGERDYVELPRVESANANAKAAVPVREGFEFAGWSLVPAHTEDADHWGVTQTTGDIFRIENTLTKRYYAHWKAVEYDVVLNNNDSGASSATRAVKVATGSTAGLADFSAPTHVGGSGYVFLGYYDAAEGGTVYFTATGAAARPWDKLYPQGANHITLYAHWLNAGGTTPSSPDALPPDPGDLIPGKAPLTVTPTSAPNGNHVDLAALPGVGGLQQALLGTYDGVYAVPAAGGDEVAIVMASYTPAEVSAGTVASTQLALRNMISSFEGSAAPEDAPYLQGFEVLSTGSTILVSDLYEGRQVNIGCLRSDLAELAAPQTLASFKFLPGKVRAIYGPNPPIKPEDWDPAKPWPSTDDPNTSPADEATPIHNTFDARGGFFVGTDEQGAAYQKRFSVLASGYHKAVEVPADPKNLSDETYQFDGWYTADGKKLEAGATQQSATPTTYYARYVRTYYTFNLVNDWDGVDDVHKTSEVADGTFASFDGNSLGWPYKGQALSAMDFTASGTPQLTGYDFIGWYYREAGAGADGADRLVPFWLNPDSYADAYRTDPTTDYKDRLGVGGGSVPAIPNAHESTQNTVGWGELLAADLAADGKVELHALWHKMTYSIRLQYNWGGNGGYVYQVSDGAGGQVDAADTVIENVQYGDSIDALVPAIKDPVYQFQGWYAGQTEGSRQVLYKKVDYSSGHDPDDTPEFWLTGTPGTTRTPFYFVARNGQHFWQPTNLGTLPAGRQITLNAWFDSAGAPEGYVARFYLGQSAADVHGTLLKHPFEEGIADGVPYIDVPYYPSADYPLTDGANGVNLFLKADNGFSRAGYSRSADPNAKIEASVTLDAGTTGLQEFWVRWTDKPYQVRFVLETLRITDDQGNATMQKPDGSRFASEDDSSIPLSMATDKDSQVALPVPQGTKGYDFAGWRRVDANGAFLAQQAGDGYYEYGADQESFTFDDAYAPYIDRNGYTVDAAGNPTGQLSTGSNGRVIYYGAVWVPRTYQVLFHENATAETHTPDGVLLASEGGEGAGDATGYAHQLTLPYMHTQDNGNVFLFWSFLKTDTAGLCRSWTSGETRTLRQLIDGARDYKAVEGPDANGLYTIHLYGQWQQGKLSDDDFIINVDVPLQVNILLDPWTPDRDDGEGKIITNSAGAYEYAEGENGEDVVVANGWVGANTSLNASLAERGVRVESLTYERGENLFTRGEGGTGADDSGKFQLRVYGGGLGQQVSPLSLNLGTAGTVVLYDRGTDQSDHIAPGVEQKYLMEHGLGKVIRTGDPLLVYYDLTWDDGVNLADYPALTKTLLDKGTSSTIAKLYYTIGIAPEGE